MFNFIFFVNLLQFGDNQILSFHKKNTNYIHVLINNPIDNKNNIIYRTVRFSVIGILTHFFCLMEEEICHTR